MIYIKNTFTCIPTFFSVDHLRCGKGYIRKELEMNLEDWKHIFKFIFHSRNKRSFKPGTGVGGVLITEKIPLWYKSENCDFSYHTEASQDRQPLSSSSRRSDALFLADVLNISEYPELPPHPTYTFSHKNLGLRQNHPANCILFLFLLPVSPWLSKWKGTRRNRLKSASEMRWFS